VSKLIRKVSDRSNQQRSPGSTPGLFLSWALLHTPSLEETGVGGVPFDISGFALLGDIDFVLCVQRVLADFGIVTSAFVAAIGWRHWRHLIVARHACFLY
jgi:hypothetical protein